MNDVDRYLLEVAAAYFFGFLLMMTAAALTSRLAANRRGFLARAAGTAALTLTLVATLDVMPNGFYRWRLAEHGLKIAGAMAVSYCLIMLFEWIARTFAAQDRQN